MSEVHIDHQQRLDVGAGERLAKLFAIRQRQAALVPVAHHHRSIGMFDHLLNLSDSICECLLTC